MKKRTLWVLTALLALIAVTVGSGWATGRSGEAPKLVGRSAQVGVDERQSFERLVAGRSHLQPAAGASPMSRIETLFRGGKWSVMSYRNEAGETCFAGGVAGGGIGVGCLAPDELYARGPIHYSWGGRQADDLTRWDTMWLWGKARPGITSLSIVTTDCSARSVELDASGIFLYLAEAEALYNGAWPYRITGRNAVGKVVANQRLNVFAPPRADGNVAGATPAAAAACA
jgi:hypothetical protein